MLFAVACTVALLVWAYRYNRKFRILVRCCYLGLMWAVCALTTMLVDFLSPTTAEERPPASDITESLPGGSGFDPDAVFLDGYSWNAADAAAAAAADDAANDDQDDEDLMLQLSHPLRQRAGQRASSQSLTASSSSSSSSCIGTKPAASSTSGAGSPTPPTSDEI